ncbi:MAG: hypothetical protein FK731_04300 [Asgard group archaeon]|nr:hypothetical protein [Asgard group archaeon]
MKKRCFKILTIILLQLVLLLNFNSKIQIGFGKNYKINSYLGAEPNIDGNILEGEWDAAGKATEISIINPWDLSSTNTISLFISSIHNESNLYIGSKVDLDNIYRGEITYYFHSNRAFDFRDETTQLNDDNDVKIINSNSNCSFDGFTDEGGIIEDYKYGGVNNSIGKCFISQTSIMFELKLPFYSGDDIGHDIYTLIDDEFLIHISLELYFYRNPGEKDGGIYKLPIGSPCKLIISNSTTAPISIYSIIFGLILLIIVDLVKRKKVKKLNY